jgi:pimeloyl-ACP methyl ester carboxylesterase
MRRALALTIAVLLAACTSAAPPKSKPSGSTSGSTPGTTSGTGADPFQWADFGSTGRVQTGHLVVPLDYSDASKGTIDLYVARHLAKPGQRIGSLLVNPGGPGFGGSDFALHADNVYSKVLLDRFDIVGWDPRGTGLSEPAIDCFSDYDHFFAGNDITPDTQAERQQLIDLAKELAGDCVTKNPDLAWFGTNNSARDMNEIRKALGEQKISYFGFSYGSELGATWATLFPDTVRAAVLDGAVDPNAGFAQSSIDQSQGFEGTLNTFLARCSGDSGCPFHNGGAAAAAFDALMLRIDDHPIPTSAGRPDLTRGMAVTAVAEAMYSQSLWPDLESGLADAQRGDGAGLLALYDQYYQRNADGTYDNSLEAFQVISCDDTAERPTVAEDDATAPKTIAVAPRISPYTTGLYFCTFFPKATDPRVAITGKGAGTILVMGTTGDPATPLASTMKMARALEGGRLVIVKGDQHTGYGINACSRSTVDDYLVDPVQHAPKDGTRCE